MDWKIGKSNRRCCVCEAELVMGEAFYSTLNQWEGGLERRDFCLQCWQNSGEEKQRPDFFWRTTQADDVPKKRSIDLEVVTDLFRKLPESSDPMRQKVRYFLALLLMRKRVVKLLSTGREDERDFMSIRLRGEEKEQRVTNPNLTQGELDEVKAELELLLEMELGQN